MLYARCIAGPHRPLAFYPGHTHTHHSDRCTAAPLQVYGVSWAGQIICCYDIVAGPSLSPRGTGDNGGDPLERGGAEAERLRFGGAGASSMSFNDTLQVWRRRVCFSSLKVCSGMQRSFGALGNAC